MKFWVIKVAAGSWTWEGTTKKKLSTLALLWPPCFCSNFKALQLTQHYTDLHHLKAVSMFTVQKLQRCSHNHQREKKKPFGIEITAKGRTQNQLRVSCSPFWCNIFFHVLTINFCVRQQEKKVNKGTVTLLWISYVPGNTLSSNDILKPKSTKSVMEAKTKEALSLLFGRSHSHGYATFKCACASIHTDIAHTPTLNILCVPMHGWAELICWLSRTVHTNAMVWLHTHTHTHACLPAHVRKMKESWQSAASSLSTAANLLSYATAGSPPNCKSFFSA